MTQLYKNHQSVVFARVDYNDDPNYRERLTRLTESLNRNDGGVDEEITGTLKADIFTVDGGGKLGEVGNWPNVNKSLSTEVLKEIKDAGYQVVPALQEANETYVDPSSPSLRRLAGDRGYQLVAIVSPADRADYVEFPEEALEALNLLDEALDDSGFDAYVKSSLEMLPKLNKIAYVTD